MPTSPYFPTYHQGHSGEQTLVQNLVDEQIKLFGSDIYYLPKTVLADSTLDEVRYTALMKRQWGMNLIKYNNVQLPGGVTLNGREIYTDALAEIETLESEVLSKYAIPPMDMIG